MSNLTDKQKRFLQWIVDTQDNKMNTTISQIILEQGIYGEKLKILLNELVDIYKHEYLKFTHL